MGIISMLNVSLRGSLSSRSESRERVLYRLQRCIMQKFEAFIFAVAMWQQMSHRHIFDSYLILSQVGLMPQLQVLHTYLESDYRRAPGRDCDHSICFRCMW